MNPFKRDEESDEWRPNATVSFIQIIHWWMEKQKKDANNINEETIKSVFLSNEKNLE